MKSLTFKEWVCFTLIVVAIFAVLSILPSKAYSEGNIGLSLDRSVDESNAGVFGDYETDVGPLGLEIEGQLQSGDVYDGHLNLAVLWNLKNIGFRVASDNDLKGYSLDTLGRQNNLGLDFVVPLGGSGVELSVGVFGRNGNPFEKPSALNTLLDEGFVEDEIAPLGLADVYPKDRGIVLPDGSAAGMAIKGEFDVSRFEVGLKALLELLGEGDKVHQLRLDIGTGGALGNTGLEWQINANIAAQSSAAEDSDGRVIQYETSWMSGINYPF